MAVLNRSRRTVLKTALLAGIAGSTGSVRAQDEPDGYETVSVPQQYETIQEGVDQADPGDLVLIDEGEYQEEVEVTTPEITVRGTERNSVILDGAFDRDYGIDVEADGVALENMTARHYTENAFYWSDVTGFRGSYLTAYNNGTYGVYAYRSTDGRFEHCYASGHADAGFYLGRNEPFHAVITNVIAEHNAVGYSGTSAGGDLTIKDSLWMNNMAGIVPNTLGTNDPPQRSNRIVRNVVLRNDNVDAPNEPLMYPTFGTGILIWGGNDNLVAENYVAEHDHFGIAIEPNVDEPGGNVVRGNVVRDSGIADLALGVPVEPDNRFAHNGFSSSLPVDIQDDASDGAQAVSDVYDELAAAADRDDFPAGDWRDQPEPPNQPPMPDPGAPPRPARKDAAWGDG